MKYRCPKCKSVINRPDFEEAYCGCTNIPTYPRMIPISDDDDVVARFNELWKKQKVAVRPTNDLRVCEYYLVPTPQYRPFNTSDEFKLSGFCGKKVRHKKSGIVREITCMGLDRVWLYHDADYDWQQMFDTYVWNHTGEPFGVKID